MESSHKVQVLLTGDELMSGVTTDSNSAMIAEKLDSAGLVVFRKVTIGDNLEQLVAEIKSLASNSDILIINGGLGPTVDDLTAQALAMVVNEPLVEHAVAVEHLTKWCAVRNYPLNNANLKQAFLPRSVTIIANAVGSAVGFQLTWNNCLIICTPGIPSELRAMLDAEIVPYLKKCFPHNTAPMVTRLQLFGLGESGLQQLITDQFPQWPKEVTLSFRAGLPILELKLITTDIAHDQLKKQCRENLNAIIGDCIIGEGATNLQFEVVALFKQRGLTLTTVESCTGGLIASCLTEVPGASSIFEAGFVTYSNTMKLQLVGVKSETIEQHGAVSEEVVREMLEGGLKKSGAHYGVSVSGIAGPDGGTAEKPVGTVWIAWGQRTGIKAAKLVVRRQRKTFQVIVAAIALDLIRREVMGIVSRPPYFEIYR